MNTNSVEEKEFISKLDYFVKDKGLLTVLQDLKSSTSSSLQDLSFIFNLLFLKYEKENYRPLQKLIDYPILLQLCLQFLETKELILLTRYNSKWKNIIEKNPFVWKYTQLSIGGKEQLALKTKACPFLSKLHFSTLFTCGDHEANHIQKCLEQFTCLNALRFGLGYSPHTEKLLYSTNSFQNVKCLILDGYSGLYHHYEICLNILFTQMTKLEKLKLYHTRIKSFSAFKILSVPLHTLKLVNIRLLDPSSAYDLCACKNLTSVSLEFDKLHKNLLDYLLEQNNPSFIVFFLENLEYLKLKEIALILLSLFNAIPESYFLERKEWTLKKLRLDLPRTSRHSCFWTSTWKEKASKCLSIITELKVYFCQDSIKFFSSTMEECFSSLKKLILINSEEKEEQQNTTNLVDYPTLTKIIEKNQTTLKYIELEGGNFTSWKVFFECSALEYLSLSSTSKLNITEARIQTGHFPKLKTLLFKNIPSSLEGNLNYLYPLEHKLKHLEFVNVKVTEFEKKIWEKKAIFTSCKK